MSQPVTQQSCWVRPISDSTDQILSQGGVVCIIYSNHLFRRLISWVWLSGPTQRSDSAVWLSAAWLSAAWLSAAWLSGLTINRKRSFMRRPGIEPRANAWKAFMLPLHHRRCWRTRLESWSSCFDRESNTGPQDLQSCALPTELSKLIKLHPLDDI